MPPSEICRAGMKGLAVLLPSAALACAAIAYLPLRESSLLVASYAPAIVLAIVLCVWVRIDVIVGSLALIAGVVLLLLGTNLALDYRNFAVTKAAVDLRVSDAVSHDKAYVFGFSEGRVRGELAGMGTYYSSSCADCADTLEFTHAAPFVPAGWTADDPVQVWAVCSGAGCGWPRTQRAGHISKELNREAAEAVANAMHQHHLRSVAHPLLLVMDDSVQSAGAAAKRSLLGMFIGFTFVWSAGFLALAFHSARLRRLERLGRLPLPSQDDD